MAAVKLMGLYEEQLQRGKGQLEAPPARHWPELDGLPEPGTATQLGLLRAYGSAAAVAADPDGAAALMGKLGGWRLSQEKVAAVLEAAGHSTGLEPREMERVLIMELCAELERARQLEAKRASRQRPLIPSQRHWPLAANHKRRL